MTKSFPHLHSGIVGLGAILTIFIGCATPSLMKRWEREEQRAVESENFVVFLDDRIPATAGREVLQSLEFARDRVGRALGFYTDEKVVCNLYRSERNLRNVSVGLPLGFFVPRRAPLAYVLGGEVHGRLYCTSSGHISRLWVSTFPHEYCHIMFKQVTGRHYFQYSWLQEGLGEYFRRLYLQENVIPPESEEVEPQFVLASHRRPARHSKTGTLLLRDTRNGVWSYTDWEVRRALRHDNVVPLKSLSPLTFIGYWRKFNTPDANQVYALSASAVETLIRDYGWDKMRLLLSQLKEDRNLDRVMKRVYGFDQDEFFELWLEQLKKRWPDPWEPAISMVYLVRGNWEIDGHEAGIRTALAERDLDGARLHQNYLLARSISGLDPSFILPVSHSGRSKGVFGHDPLSQENGLPAPVYLHPGNGRGEKAPAIEHYEAAMAEYSIGRFEEGVDHLLVALEMEPEQMPFIRVHLARGLWLINQKDKAIELYELELLENDDPGFLNEVAWCYEHVGDIEAALGLYRDIARSAANMGLRMRASARSEILERGFHPKSPSLAATKSR